LAAPINRIGRERLHAGWSKLTSIHELRRLCIYLNQGHAAGADADPALREYVEAHLDWFQTLREYSDYVTHYASIDISFHEPREGVLRAYLHDALQVHEVVAPVGSHPRAAPR
jgi:hypothetical protein